VSQSTSKQKQKKPSGWAFDGRNLMGEIISQV
jgi:hypothetical protein